MKLHACLWFKGEKLEGFSFPVKQPDLKVGMKKSKALSLTKRKGWKNPSELTTAIGTYVNFTCEVEHAKAAH